MKHILRLVNYCDIPSLLWQEPEKELIILLLIKVSDRDRNVKRKNVGCDS